MSHVGHADDVLVTEAVWCDGQRVLFGVEFGPSNGLVTPRPSQRESMICAARSVAASIPSFLTAQQGRIVSLS